MADKKLRFHVVYASGEDPQYPASELNVHSSKVSAGAFLLAGVNVAQTLYARVLLAGDAGLCSAIFLLEIISHEAGLHQGKLDVLFLSRTHLYNLRILQVLLIPSRTRLCLR